MPVASVCQYNHDCERCPNDDLCEVPTPEQLLSELYDTATVLTGTTITLSSYSGLTSVSSSIIPKTWVDKAIAELTSSGYFHKYLSPGDHTEGDASTIIRIGGDSPNDE